MCLYTKLSEPLVAQKDIPVIKVLACIKQSTPEGKIRYVFVGPFGYNDNFTYTPRKGAITRQTMEPTPGTELIMNTLLIPRRLNIIGPGLHSYTKEFIEKLWVDSKSILDHHRPEVLVKFVIPKGTPYYTDCGDSRLLVSEQLRWVEVLTPLISMHHSIRNALFDANGELPE